MRISRRRLVGGGIATAAATGVAVAMPRAPGQGLTRLNTREALVVEAVGRALFPGRRLPDIYKANLVQRVDHLVHHTLEPAASAGFRGVLRTLEWATVASRGAPFSELSLERQREVLRVWALPDPVPRRVACESLRAVLAMAYFGSPAVQRAVGWRTGCGEVG